MNEVDFSIIIPVWNREREIARSLKSCQIQSFSRWEVIIIDDASDDDTCKVVQGLQNEDKRIKLLRHTENKGVGPARNTGIKAANGKWILFLDSDDELLPGALDVIQNYTKECPEDIVRLGFLYIRDDGRVSPEPKPHAGDFDYEEYLRESAKWHLSDFFHCSRRAAFQKVSFQESRAFEAAYLLDFARLFRTRMIAQVVAMVHTDSANRARNLSVWQRMCQVMYTAADQGKATEYILTRHGDALKRHTPERFKMFCKIQALFYFLAGNKKRGTRLAIDYLRVYPKSIVGWVILALGLLSSHVLAFIQVIKSKGE